MALGKIMDKLSSERKLVVCCSKGMLLEGEAEYVKQLLTEKLDWKEILFQAVSHRCLNILYYHLRELDCLKAVDGETLKLMKNQFELAKIRNTFYYKELDTIFEEFNKENIKAAILKGNFLSREVYPEIETRTFNDLDMLISLNDASKVVAAVEKLGYIQGDYDAKLNQIVPSTRRQKMYHQMTTHELQECLKLTDYPFTKILEVDFNHDILWKGNCPYKICTEEFLERADKIKIEQSEAYVLDREDCLLQLICHLYKEAVVINWIAEARDLKLYKFADIATYAIKYQNEIDWQKLITRAHNYKCEKVVYYVLYYVQYLYGDVIPDNILEQFTFDNYDFLNEYGVENENVKYWKSEFHERLFELERIEELTEEDKIKNTEFWNNKGSDGKDK